jgi:putative FmdB family regulatory protein
MPTYEYECNACGLRFERFQSMGDSPVESCPDCGGAVRRLISGGTAVLVRRANVACALWSTGRTCCGREQRCGTPSCEGKE